MQETGNDPPGVLCICFAVSVTDIGDAANRPNSAASQHAAVKVKQQNFMKRFQPSSVRNAKAEGKINTGSMSEQVRHCTALVHLLQNWTDAMRRTGGTANSRRKHTAARMTPRAFLFCVKISTEVGAAGARLAEGRVRRRRQQVQLAGEDEG